MLLPGDDINKVRESEHKEGVILTKRSSIAPRMYMAPAYVVPR